jgi:hypothetical protein
MGSCAFGAIQTLFGNRRLAAGMLAVDFKKPWNFLVEARAEGRSPEAHTRANLNWWCIYKKVRTHFAENPQ